MLMTKVKASSINNLTDARYFAALEVEWIGFCLDPSLPQHVSPQQVAAIAEWVDGVKIAGEMGGLSVEDMQSVIQTLSLDTIQVGAPRTPAEMQELSHVEIIREWQVFPGQNEDELEAELEAWSGIASYYLLDLGQQAITWTALQNGKAFSLDTLKEWCERFPILIDLDWGPHEVQDILQELQPSGLAFKGGEEEKVGFKSFEELDEILEDLQVEE